MATDLAAAATDTTYLEAATAELQNRFQREWGSRLDRVKIGEVFKLVVVQSQRSAAVESIRYNAMRLNPRWSDEHDLRLGVMPCH